MSDSIAPFLVGKLPAEDDGFPPMLKRKNAIRLGNSAETFKNGYPAFKKWCDKSISVHLNGKPDLGLAITIGE